MGKQPGRPKGAKQKSRKWVWHTPVRCPTCRLTYRAPYHQRPYKEIQQGGIAPDGQPYNLVRLRRTVCEHCGQHLVVKSFENRPEEKM